MRPLSHWLVVVVFSLVAGVGCTKKVGVEQAVSVSGEAADPASALAYEHQVSISVAKQDVDSRMQDVRTACTELRFGACELLQFEQRQGDWPGGTLVMRAAPDAIEPMVKLAGTSGTVGNRSTIAHDLSRHVAESDRELQRLQARRAELVAFRERENLAVADMLALANEIATVETSLAEVGKRAAEHDRRISTNLLTLQWSSYGTESAWSAVREAITDSGDTAIEGLAEAISYLVMLIPALLLAFPLALLWRAAWRRATGTSRGRTGSE